MSVPQCGFPRSDHFDGHRFHNPGAPAPQRGLGQVVRWRMQGGRATWPFQVPNGRFQPPPPAVPPATAAISFVGHATFLIRLTEAVVLTDPMFSQRCSPLSWAGPQRARAPGVALADLPRPDVVLLSHNHYDHMDLPSLRGNRGRSPGNQAGVAA